MTAAESPMQHVRISLFFTAFLTGAVVMALEMLGSRLLAPVFGNSVLVWGALIGVILAAMSSGYATGGSLADRFPGEKVLTGLLLFSGVWTLLLAWMGEHVMFTVDALVQDPRWGPCLAGAIMLAPPAFGLSGVLPILLRLAIGDLGSLGRHTGIMIAVSTFGSLVGTFGTAFYLLTWLGSRSLVIILGFVQIVLGVFWMWKARQIRVHSVIPLLLVLVVSHWLVLHPIRVLPQPLYQEDSPYQQIRVRDDDLFRYLILDRTFHAVMWRVDPIQLFLPYSQLFVVALANHPDPRQALVLGHGGGSMGKWLGAAWPDLQVDLVEVDPSVVRVAKEYFDYALPANHNVYVKDARVFLQQTPKQYDIIWVDVFARHLIPFHLTTKEFFQELKEHLTSDGLVVVNLASSGEGPDNARARAVVSTMGSEFPTIASFGVKGPWRSTAEPKAENLLFFAGPQVGEMGKPSFTAKLEKLINENRLPFQALELMNSRVTTPWGKGLILTDDYAPYDLLVGHEFPKNPLVQPSIHQGE